ncbi:hypothetical protein BHM03_00024059 [Ensete ventricosum]|nr:hypothetical protein BHM03_00024059 [Ensete ventricosum]
MNITKPWTFLTVCKPEIGVNSECNKCRHGVHPCRRSRKAHRDRHRPPGDGGRCHPRLRTHQQDPPTPLRVSLVNLIGRFHFYGDDMTRQVEAHHFCSHQNEEMRQCLIYDDEGPGAKLIGVEYLVSEALFLALPDDEKPLWHSHEYEVKSGMLFMPQVPGAVQRRDMEQVCKTYGKTYHFWQVDRGDELPLGLPQLMMAFTRDGQLRQELAKGLQQYCRSPHDLFFRSINWRIAVDIERRYEISFEEEREKRQYMAGPDHGIHPLANGAGKGRRLELREVDVPPVGSVPRAFF